MAKRMIRDWTASDKIDKISAQAERFFIRLCMKADDFGCYLANVKFMNGNLFPLKDDIKDDDVSRWFDECVKVNLIEVYHVKAKRYLQIRDFGQRLDKAVSKYPQPKDADNQEESMPGKFRENSGKIRAELELELEVEVEEELEVELPRENSRLIVWPSFNDFWELYDKKVDRPKCESRWKKINQAAREKIMTQLPEYIRTTPDKQYRKNPATYLNNKSWENEIQNGTTKLQITNKHQQHTARLADHFVKTYGSVFSGGEAGQSSGTYAEPD